MQFLIDRERINIRVHDFTEVNSSPINLKVSTEHGRKKDYCVFVEQSSGKLAACRLAKFHKPSKEEVYVGPSDGKHITSQKLVNSVLLADKLPLDIFTASIKVFDQTSLEDLFLHLSPQRLGQVVRHLYPLNPPSQLSQDMFMEWMKNNLVDKPHIVASVLKCAETIFINTFLSDFRITPEQYLTIINSIEPKKIVEFISKFPTELNLKLLDLTIAKFMESEPDLLTSQATGGTPSLEATVKKSQANPSLTSKEQQVVIACLVEQLSSEVVVDSVKAVKTESLVLLLNNVTAKSWQMILNKMEECQVKSILQLLNKGECKESAAETDDDIDLPEFIDVDDVTLSGILEPHLAERTVPSSNDQETLTVTYGVVNETLTKAARIIFSMDQEQFVTTFRNLELSEIVDFVPHWRPNATVNKTVTQAQCDSFKKHCSKLGQELAVNNYDKLLELLDYLSKEFLVAFIADLDAKIIAKLACEAMINNGIVLMQSGKPEANLSALCDILVCDGNTIDTELAELAPDNEVERDSLEQIYNLGKEAKLKLIMETARSNQDIDIFSKYLATNLLEIKSVTRISALLNSFDSTNDKALFSLVMKEMMLSENFEHILAVLNGLDMNHKMLLNRILSDEDIIKIAITMNAENIIKLIKVLQRLNKVELIQKITKFSSEQRTKLSKFCTDLLDEKDEEIIEFFTPRTLIKFLSNLDESLNTVDDAYLLKIILGSTKHNKTAAQTLMLLPRDKSVDLILLYIEHQKSSCTSESESILALGWSQELINHLGVDYSYRMIEKLTQKGFVRESLAVCTYLKKDQVVDALKCIFTTQNNEQFAALVNLLTTVIEKKTWRDRIARTVSKCDVEIRRKFFNLGDVSFCLMLTRKVDEKQVIEAFEDSITLNNTMRKIMWDPNEEIVPSLEAFTTSQIVSQVTRTPAHPLTKFLQDSKEKLILWCIENQDLDTSEWIEALETPESWSQNSISKNRSSKRSKIVNSTVSPKFHLLTATLAPDKTSLIDEISLSSALRGCNSSDREMWLKAMSPLRRSQVMLLLSPYDAGEMLIKFHDEELSKMLDCEAGSTLLEHIEPNEEPLPFTDLTDSLPSDSSSRSRTLTLRRGQIQILEHSWNTLKSMSERVKLVVKEKRRSLSLIPTRDVVKSKMTSLFEKAESNDLAQIVFRMEPQAAHCLLDKMNAEKAMNVSRRLIESFYSNITNSNVVDLSSRIPASTFCSLYRENGIEFSQLVQIVNLLMSYGIEAIGKDVDQDVDNGVIVVEAVEEILHSLSDHEITALIQALTNQTDTILSFCEKPDEIVMKFDGEMWGKLISALSQEAFKDIVNLSSQAKAQAVLTNFRLDSVNYLLSLYEDNLDTRNLILNNIKIEVLTDYIKEKFAQGQKIDETLTLLPIDKVNSLLTDLRKPAKTNKEQTRNIKAIIKVLENWKTKNKIK